VRMECDNRFRDARIEHIEREVCLSQGVVLHIRGWRDNRLDYARGIVVDSKCPLVESLAIHAQGVDFCRMGGIGVVGGHPLMVTAPGFYSIIIQYTVWVLNRC
jgi:hypothetical protein